MIDNDDGYKVTFGSGELQMIMVMAQHPEKSYCIYSSQSHIA